LEHDLGSRDLLSRKQRTFHACALAIQDESGPIRAIVVKESVGLGKTKQSPQTNLPCCVPYAKLGNLSIFKSQVFYFEIDTYGANG
jgi:hypothetical protein